MGERTVRIVGPGRAGRSMAAALADAGWDVVDVLGRDASPAALGSAADGVDLVIIATPDASIATVAAAIEPGGAVVAHLAGSLGLDALAPHDAGRRAVHPLVALPNPELGRQRLQAGAWFGIAGHPIAAEVVTDLGGSSFEVHDDDRATYHAAACIASNHLVALLGQAERVASTAGVPFEAYLDLVRATVENVSTLGPADALTGPAARGDEATLARHVAALDPSEREAYEAMVRLARRLAE